MKNSILALCFLALISAAIGCRGPTVSNANRANYGEMAAEGTIVFVRPTRFVADWIPGMGTHSLSEYVEITYERASKNDAGLLNVNIGFRDRGGQKFWDRAGPSFPLSVKTVFYDRPLSSMGGPTSPPVYETNWQTVTLVRGGTEHYQVVCPATSGAYYQVTVSELLK